ncbi:MAG: hypothetical protein J7L88_03435 [Thermoplasmata archaeon]|nr:hypothetical protein [Thermoplasmata archaeon]
MGDNTVNAGKKLDYILKKTENFLQSLNQIGLDVSSPSTKLKEARKLYSQKRWDEALRLVEETIKELQAIKEEYNKMRGEASSKGKGVYALFRSDEEASRKQLEEWKLILESWRDEGYDVGDIEEVFKQGTREIEEFFVKISRNVENSERYQKELEEMLKDKRLPSDLRIQLQNIKEKLKNVKDFEMVEEKFLELKEEYNKYLKELEEARARIENLEKKGYYVDRIKLSLERDSYDIFKERYKTFLKSVEMLKKVEEKLDEISKDPYLMGILGDKIEEIKNLVKDPRKIEEVQKLLSPLLKEVKASQEGRRKKEEEEAFRKRVSEEAQLWEEEGFNVTVLKKSLNDPVEKLKEVYERYNNGVEKIKEMKKELLSLDGVGFEDEIADLALSLVDPLKAGEYSEKVKALVEKVEERNRVLDHLQEKVRQWKKLGYILTPLERYLKNPGGLDETLQYLQQYQKNFQKAVAIENEIKDVQGAELRKMASEVLGLLKNLSNLEPALKRYQELKKVMEKEKVVKEKWKTFNDVSRGWREKGYNITSLLEKFLKVKNDPDKIDELLEDYRKRISRLEELKKEYEGIKKGVFKDLEEEMEALLKDPESLIAAERILAEIKAREANLKYLKEKMEKFMEKMEEKGVSTSTLRKKIEEDPAHIKEIAEEFRDRLKEFAKIKKEIITKLREEGKEAEIEKVRAVNDPYMLEDLINKYTPLLFPELATGERGVEELLNEAQKAYKEKDYEKALELYNKVLEKDPENRKASFFVKRIKVLMKGKKG